MLLIAESILNIHKHDINKMILNIIIDLFLFTLLSGMVICQRCGNSQTYKNNRCVDNCPRRCDWPRSEQECQACLDKGYSDIVRGRGLNVDLLFYDKLQ